MFHWMDVEVLTKGNQNPEAPIALDGFTEAFDAPPVSAYRLTLKGNQQLDLKRNAHMLIVGLTAESNVMANEKSFLKQGDFFLPASKTISIANKEKKQYSFAVLEFK